MADSDLVYAAVVRELTANAVRFRGLTDSVKVRDLRP